MIFAEDKKKQRIHRIGIRQKQRIKKQKKTDIDRFKMNWLRYFLFILSSLVSWLLSISDRDFFLNSLLTVLIAILMFKSFFILFYSVCECNFLIENNSHDRNNQFGVFLKKTWISNFFVLFLCKQNKTKKKMSFHRPSPRFTTSFKISI